MGNFSMGSHAWFFKDLVISYKQLHNVYQIWFIFISQNYIIYIKKFKRMSNIPNPNCCSRRMPMKTRLSMFATRWITPACNQMQVTSLHPWCFWTTLVHSSAPNLSNLQELPQMLLIESFTSQMMEKDTQIIEVLVLWSDILSTV